MPIGFTVTLDTEAGLHVALKDAAGLDDVYELCLEVAHACLHHPNEITFARR